MSNIDLSQAISADSLRQAKNAALFEQLAELRYSLENEPVDLPDGMEIQGNREARQELAAQHFLRQTGVAEGPVYWKGPSGWITLSPDMLGLALWKISNRIQALFEAEKLFQDKISTSDFQSFAVVADGFLAHVEWRLSQ